MWHRIKEWLNIPGGNQGNQSGRRRTGVVDTGDALLVYVACDRCGEVIKVRLRKSSDIQRNDEAAEYAYYVQKTVVGNECFNRIDMRLELDNRYRPTGTVMHGGVLVDPDGENERGSEDEKSRR